MKFKFPSRRLRVICGEYILIFRHGYDCHRVDCACGGQHHTGISCDVICEYDPGTTIMFVFPNHSLRELREHVAEMIGVGEHESPRKVFSYDPRRD